MAAALSACGGGGGDGGGTDTGPATGLPDQTGCVHQYSLTGSAVLSGADPLLLQQWHLENSGQSGGIVGEDLRARAAWALTQGAGARVAVVDDALETLHEDLAPNVVAGASYSYRPGAVGSAYPLPCGALDDHGTAVAGIVAARDGNAVGGAGVAPRVSLVGYNALATGYVADIADALTRGLADNGVYNNSWGSPDDGTPSRADSSFIDAIETGLASGRSGRGAIYVFPGGNGGCYATDSAGNCYSETSGLDGYVNHRGIVTVCAVDHRGRKPQYVEPGANLLVCGFTGNDSGSVNITTTALHDAYRSDFSGGSASAPMVSGVAAMVLSVNPQLSWRDVRLILAQTARRNDPGNPGWAPSPFAPPFSHDYGFGVADAKAAVEAAGTWSSVGGSEAMKSCGPYQSSPGLALPDATGQPSNPTVTPREDAITIGADCAITKIEYVEIGFTAAHAYSGDLRIRLTSPNGLISRLVEARVCAGSGDACGAYDDWRFGSVRHLNEPAGGPWRLQVTDMQAQDTGTWQHWSLRLWGR